MAKNPAPVKADLAVLAMTHTWTIINLAIES